MKEPEEEKKDGIDKKITPEIQAQLNELRGYTPDSTYLWVPPLIKQYELKENWPVFKYRNRNAKDHAEAEDQWNVYNEGGMLKTNVAILRITVLSKLIIEWKNYKDKHGNLIPCTKKDDVIVEESMNQIAKEMQIQLLDAINAEDHLTEEELTGLEF